MPLTSSLHRLIATIAAGGAAAVGLSGLTAWGLDWWPLASFGAQLVPMAPITALLIFLGGGSFVWRLRQPDGRESELVLLGSAGFITLIAGLELLRSSIGGNFPWDPAHGAVLAGPAGTQAGRMARITAAALVLLALAFAGGFTRLRRRPGVHGLTKLAAIIGASATGIVVLGYTSGSPLGYGPDSIPMALPTAIALLALFFATLIADHADGAPAGTADEGRPIPADRFFFLRMNQITFGILIVAAGIFFLRSQEREARDEAFRNLDNIAALKALELGQWQNERRDDARFLQRTPAIRADIAAFLAGPGDAAARQSVLGWLESMRSRRNPYVSARIYDPAGRLRLATPATAGPANLAAAPGFIAALGSADVVIGDMRSSGSGGAPRIEMYAAVPGPASSGSSGPAAVIVLEIDPAAALFFSLLRWPVPSNTGELVLARREGEEVVFLNRSQVSHGILAPLRRPISDADLPAAMGARGEFGVHEGHDYQGVAVLAAIRPVPDSAWVLVAKVNQEEAYAEQVERVPKTGPGGGLVFGLV